MKAYIIVGFTEGKWHMRRMRKVLRLRGIALTKSIKEADYVIAHSGGCYDVPELNDHQTLMLINPTYWPGKPIRARAITMTYQIIRSMRPGNRLGFHLNKTAHNLLYSVRHRSANRRMMQRSKTFNLEEEIRHKRTILVRNYHDPWLTPDLDKLQAINPHLQVARLAGEHDDCWLQPDPYIQLLLKYQA